MQSDENIKNYKSFISPRELWDAFKLSKEQIKFIESSRQEIKDIIDGKDSRKIIIVGPCSMHSLKDAKNYIDLLAELKPKLQDKFLILVRTYFEKPRTTVGWKGLIYDPHLDDTFDMKIGLFQATEILTYAINKGLATATEFLDVLTPQYIAGYVSWAAIGARNTESQVHRQMASGLSMPVGFKNGTKGNLDVAINGILSCKYPHSFIGINKDGEVSQIQTKGNEAHMILRGGDNGPNHNNSSVNKAIKACKDSDITPNLVIDCSHANSNKDPQNQPIVAKEIFNQIKEGNKNIIGIMIESNIEEGNQKIPLNLDELKSGVSITDACIDWNTTKKLLEELHTYL